MKRNRRRPGALKMRSHVANAQEERKATWPRRIQTSQRTVTRSAVKPEVLPVLLRCGRLHGKRFKNIGARTIPTAVGVRYAYRVAVGIGLIGPSTGRRMACGHGLFLCRR